MVKILSGGAMVGLDALMCASSYAGGASQSMMWGAVCLSVLGAIPLAASCADVWFDSLRGPTRSES